ncbi:hypothetical protein ACLSZP_09775 [Avibacterium avium]|uniref:hypothetical protein n=1 Tax=Avibacterium avium TaxID=751 RepID=UPI003BF8CBD5
MTYKWLNGFTASLNEKLNATDKLLPITEARGLAEKLNDDYTYLVINDGTGAEIVKAYRFGNDVKIERGQDGTQAKTFPMGACVKWEFTQSAYNDGEYNQDKDNDECVCCMPSNTKREKLNVNILNIDQLKGEKGQDGIQFTDEIKLVHGDRWDAIVFAYRKLTSGDWVMANRGTEQEESHEISAEEHRYKPVTWDVPWELSAWFKRPTNSGDIEDIVSALPELPILALQSFDGATPYGADYQRYPASEYECVMLQNNQDLTFGNLIQAGIAFEVRWRGEGGASQPVFAKKEGTSDFYSLDEEVVKKVSVMSADAFVIAKALGGVLYLSPKGEDNWVDGQDYTELTAPTGQIFHASVWKVGEVNA